MDLRLRAISERIPTASIDEVWVFPPLPGREVACEFVVLVCYDGADDRRRIVTSHVDAQFVDEEGDELEWVQRLRDHGTAPQRWLTEIPDRLLQRLAEAGVPQVMEVGGSHGAWEAAIARLADLEGNGNGKGNGNGNATLRDAAENVDSGLRGEITFSTIVEPLELTDGSNFNLHV